MGAGGAGVERPGVDHITEVGQMISLEVEDVKGGRGRHKSNGHVVSKMGN